MNMLSDNTIKHLEFIQSTINRMSSNSFSMKGWMIAVIAALLALYADSNPKNEVYLLVAACAAVLFWFIDSYYLYIEKHYRELYKDIITHTREVIPFDMSIRDYSSKRKFFKAMFCSFATTPLYLVIILTLLSFYIF